MPDLPEVHVHPDDESLLDQMTREAAGRREARDIEAHSAFARAALTGLCTSPWHGECAEVEIARLAWAQADAMLDTEHARERDIDPQGEDPNTVSHAAQDPVWAVREMTRLREERDLALAALSDETDEEASAREDADIARARQEGWEAAIEAAALAAEACEGVDFGIRALEPPA